MAKIKKLNKQELKKLNTIKAYSYKSQIVLYKNEEDEKHVYHIVHRDAWDMVAVTEVVYSLLHKKGKMKIIISDNAVGLISFYPCDTKRDIFRKLSRIVEYYNKF